MQLAPLLLLSISEICEGKVTLEMETLEKIFFWNLKAPKLLLQYQKWLVVGKTQHFSFTPVCLNEADSGCIFETRYCFWIEIDANQSISLCLSYFFFSFLELYPFFSLLFCQNSFMRSCLI